MDENKAVSTATSTSTPSAPAAAHHKSSFNSPAPSLTLPTNTDFPRALPKKRRRVRPTFSSSSSDEEEEDEHYVAAVPGFYDESEGETEGMPPPALAKLTKDSYSTAEVQEILEAREKELMDWAAYSRREAVMAQTSALTAYFSSQVATRLRSQGVPDYIG